MLDSGVDHRAGQTLTQRLMRIRTFSGIACLLLAPLTAQAQFHSYPSFQVPRISTRDFTFAIADGGRDATTLLYQWRGSSTVNRHLQFDLGVADGPPGDVRFVIGGGLAQQTHRANVDFPLDMALTAGVGGSFGDGLSLLRVPFGLSLGHTFLFDSPTALTPYVHPRVALDYCSRCGPGADGDADIGMELDLGLDVRFTRAMSMRASVLMGGTNFTRGGDSFGLSLVWSPPGFR